MGAKAMSELDPNVEQALEGLDQNKRQTLTRLIRGGAFVGPIVGAFAMQGITARASVTVTTSAVSNATKTSDIRLKREVVRIGTHPSGPGIYRFKYLWSDQTYVGTIAQDVLEHVPDAVVAGPSGFLAVDYGALGMTMERDDAQPS
jgi:hypothetical protein